MKMKLQANITPQKVHLLWIGLLLSTFLYQSQCNTNSEIDSGEDINRTDESNWIEVKSGNMPLVISAPHGGTIEPEGIPDRTCRGATTVRDRNTTELAREIGFHLEAEYDLKPYIVAALISRKKIDLNRDIELATCSHPKMKNVWTDYHDHLEQAIAEAIEEFGGVVFIDLHGHGHQKQRLELGYLLSKEELKESYNDADAAEELSGKSSLRNLVEGSDRLNFQELLTGEDAFGTLMENEGVPSVPSLDDPYPLAGDAYFTGGYNTRRYTSADYPELFGWQIEANYDGVRNSDENRNLFAKAFSKAIIVKIEEHIAN